MGTMDISKTPKKKTSSLMFDEQSSADQIKEGIRAAPGLLKLEIANCSTLEDADLLDIIPAINEELLIFIAEKVEITNRTLEELAIRCTKLQYLKLIDCYPLDADSIKQIGSHCNDLKTIAFMYTVVKEGHWTREVDALSALVKNCSSAELKAISFVNFRAIVDIGVNYAAECYFETLQKINFNNCSKLTDQSLIGLSTYCKLLRDVSLNGTKISDSGIQMLAEKCSRMHKVDFGHCPNITNYGIQMLSKKCARLEDVSFENCAQVGDDGLVALITNCDGLQIINLDNTALKKIPATIISLKRLKRFKFENCRNLSNPPPEVCAQGLESVMRFYREYNLSYRLRVYFIGDVGCGKTSLVKSLVTGAAHLATEPTEGVKSHLFQPLQIPENEDLLGRPLRLDEKQLLLELWDLSGRWICKGLHQAYLVPDALFVIVINLCDERSCGTITSYVKAVQLKCPGSTILVVATHGDAVNPGLNPSEKSKELLRPVSAAEAQSSENVKAEIAALKKLDKDLKVYQKIEQLELLLNLRPKVPSRIHVISSSTGEGLKELQRDIVSKAINSDTFSYIGRSLNPEAIRLQEKLVTLKREGGILLQGDAFRKLGLQFLPKNVLENEVDLLHASGAIIDFKLVDVTAQGEVPARFICLNPPALADMICTTHIDNPRKSFKIEARRFWPRDSGFKKPDPSVLVKALEDIPSQGLIREALFPLLWQDYRLDEHQIKLIIELLQRLGIISSHQAADNHSDGLAMPNFKSLSAHKRYYLPLMDLLTDHRPQLNWGPRPFKGDVQISWRYEFPNGAPRGMLSRLLAVCKSLQPEGNRYHYYWRYGILLRIGDALICVMHEDRHVDVCCRANADEQGQEKSSVEFIWAQLSIFILTVEHFLTAWPGLYDKISIVPIGNPLFLGDVIVGDLSYSLFEIFDYLNEGKKIYFVDDQRDRELDTGLLVPFNVSEYPDVVSWIRYILSIRETIFSLIDLDSGNDEDWASEEIQQTRKTSTDTTENGILPPHQSKRKKNAKNLEVSWNLTSADVDAPIASPSPQHVDSLLRVTDSEMGSKEINGEVEKSPTPTGLQRVPGTSDTFDRTQFLSLEEELRVANRVASGFVAMVLAGAVAEHIKAQYEDNHTLGDKPTEAQVAAASTTASVAMATQTGDMDGAAKAVITSAKGVQAALDQQEQKFRSVKSAMCTIL